MSAIQKLQEDYNSDTPEVPEPMRAILTEYSGIPKGELVEHVKEVVRLFSKGHNHSKVADSVCSEIKRGRSSSIPV